MARQKKLVHGGIEGEQQTVEEVKAEMKPVVKETIKVEVKETSKPINFIEWHYEDGLKKEIKRRALPVLGTMVWNSISLDFPFAPLAEYFPNMPDALPNPADLSKGRIKTIFGTIYAKNRVFNKEDFRAVSKKGVISQEYVGKKDRYYDVGLGDDYTVNYRIRKDGTIEPLSGDMHDVPLQR